MTKKFKKIQKNYWLYLSKMLLSYTAFRERKAGEKYILYVKSKIYVGDGIDETKLPF